MNRILQSSIRCIPQEYHDFLDIFNKSQVTKQCPPSWSKYDFKINLEPNPTLLHPMQLYHLSQKELVIMNQWLNKMLAAGMIKPCTTHCPTAAIIFFVWKKDSAKRPVIDYWCLNNCTIQDLYLSQKDPLDKKFHPVGFFSKLMTAPEQNYSILDKEALVVIKALKHWRHARRHK
jgi:hypothetical protein